MFIFLVLTLCASCYGNKYSEKPNSPNFQNPGVADKPFRMQKLNLVWEKAIKKLPAEKLKSLYTDLKFQDKEELSWKKIKAEGLDKNGLKESLILASFKAILEKYDLQEDFKALQDAAMMYQPSQSEMPYETYYKHVFRDKKLNKLWFKAEQQGFTEAQLNALKEEFQHYQDKVDQYYQMLNQLHTNQPNHDDYRSNAVEHFLYAEVGDKLWKTDNPQQALKEKHFELKISYDNLKNRIRPDYRYMDFQEHHVKTLWEMAKNASFSPYELDSLKNELHHFEHRLKKLKTLQTLAMEHDDSNIVDELAYKRNKKLKEYNYKVEKIQRELTNRILQRHSEL